MPPPDHLHAVPPVAAPSAQTVRLAQCTAEIDALAVQIATLTTERNRLLAVKAHLRRMPGDVAAVLLSGPGGGT